MTVVRGWVVIVGLVGRVMSGGSTTGSGSVVGVDVDDGGNDVGTLVGDGGEPICWAPGIKL